MIAIYCLCVIYMTLILKSATMTIESGITPVVSLYPNLIDYRCFIPYWVRAIVICAFKLIVENLFLPPLAHNCSQMPCWTSTNYLQAKMLFLSSLVDYSVIIPHIAWHHQQNTFPNVRGRNNGRKVQSLYPLRLKDISNVPLFASNMEQPRMAMTGLSPWGRPRWTKHERFSRRCWNLCIALWKCRLLATASAEAAPILPLSLSPLSLPWCRNPRGFWEA